MARLTWVLAVAGLTNSRSAISSLDSPSGDQGEHLALAVGERVERGRRRSPAAARWANSAMSRRVTPGDSSASPRATTPDRVDQVGRLGVLDQEAAGPVAQRVEHVLVEVEGGQDDDPDVGQGRVGGDVRRVASMPSRRRACGCPSARRRGAARAVGDAPPRRRRPRPRRSMSSCAASRARNPARTSAWSSTSSTRIIRSPGGQDRADREPALRHGGRPRPCRPATRPARACRPARGRRRSPPPRPPVGDVDDQLVVAVADRSPAALVDARRGGARWSATPARSGTRPGRPAPAAPRGVPGDPDVDPQPGGGEPFDQLVEPVRGSARGLRGASSSTPRSTPRVARSSRRVSRLAVLIAASAVRACSGSSSSRCRATPAWTLIREMWWATTSCTSRAMRSRSSPTRRRASSSRLCSAAWRRWRPAVATSAATRTSSSQPRWAAIESGVAGSARAARVEAAARPTTAVTQAARLAPPVTAVQMATISDSQAGP